MLAKLDLVFLPAPAPGSPDMATRLPPDDGVPFIAQLELAAAASEADIIEANMDRLERLIDQ